MERIPIQFIAGSDLIPNFAVKLVESVKRYNGIL